MGASEGDETEYDTGVARELLYIAWSLKKKLAKPVISWKNIEGNSLRRPPNPYRRTRSPCCIFQILETNIRRRHVLEVLRKREELESDGIPKS